MTDSLPEPVRTKAEMYKRLAANEFGNTIEMYFSLDSWLDSDEYRRFAQWGVRSSTVPGHPGCRMYVDRDRVPDVVRDNFPDGNVNISVMVDAVATVRLWANVWDSPSGLVVEGYRYPPRGLSWRDGMRSPPHRWEGSGARSVLRSVLNENSYEDLELLLERYPDHVVELSALDRCLGTVPHRNAVCWEVRKF